MYNECHFISLEPRKKLENDIIFQICLAISFFSRENMDARNE